ncbi:M1 family metallopeptidase [soil metagenome]
MFAKIAAFEFRYQLRNPVFWVAGVIFFLLTFGSIASDNIQIGGRGATHANSPYAIALTTLTLSIFFMFVTTAFVSNVVVRDDETGFGPMIQATPVKKSAYLMGRFAGAWLAAALAFAVIPLAILVGTFMPWIDPEKLGPLNLGHYLYAYLGLGLPSLFATGAILFALATATRSMMATYVGVIALLILYFVTLTTLRQLQLSSVAPWVDPFGIGAYSQATRYFTTADRNSLEPALWGPLIWSRALWVGIGCLFLGLAYAAYRPRLVGKAERAQTKAGKAAAKAPKRMPTPIAGVQAPAQRRFDGSAKLAQLWARTRFDMGIVFRSPAFLVLLALGLLLSLTQLFLTDSFYGTAVHPVTRLMIQTLRQTFLIIPTLVAIYYAGDLVWRDRERKVDEIVESTPAPDWSFAAPKMLAVTLVLFSMLAVSVAAAMLSQLARGYTNLEFGKYVAWYLIPESIDAAQLAILAVLVQTLAPHKFVGWLLMMGVLISQLVFGGLGFENNLYQFGSGPNVPLSDMNGDAIGGGARWWFRGYWSAICIAFAILSYGLWRRGARSGLLVRLRRLPDRLQGWAGAGLLASVVVAIGLGGFIFLNTHVWNSYHTAKADERWRADYEKTLLPFETVAQPKITDVMLHVDLYPDRPEADTRGVYVIENKTAEPIRQLHVRFDRDLKVLGLSVEGGRPLKTYDRFNYRIFAFDTPMAPGERRRVSFETKRFQHGFKNSGDNTVRVYKNGTFLDNTSIAPNLGMDRDGLLQDRAKRRKFGLPAEMRPPKLEDESARRFSGLRHDSDWVNADITLTTVADQTPIAPGYQIEDRVENGRRIARFKTEAPINDFFSLQSARYAVKHEAYKGVDLAVYYQPGHDWNVDLMIAGLKKGLDTYQAIFSPYQFRQVRILEFPGYADFAQSFANTIPYSEGIGFIYAPPKDFMKSDKIDMVTYVTAHELGHQWWAHQVISSDQQGGTSLVETMAQYSALMGMEGLYGPDHIRRFLKYELDRYLRGRGADVVEELPLARVENQQYIHYAKGSLVMYRLKDELGEEVVDRALRRLIAAYAFKPAPYPRSTEFLQFLRQETGPDPKKQQLITDLWEKITLYDLKTTEAKAVKRPDGRYDVTLKIDAKKVYADGKGKETPTPLDEMLEVGVFARSPSEAGFGPKDVLALERRPIRSGVQTLTFTVNAAPKSAGVDPYAKLIDRNADDNLAKVGG